MRSRAFWIGVLGGIVASVLIGLFALPALGLFDMTASGGSGLLDWWGHTNWERSLKWRAPETEIPASADATRGEEHYHMTCLQCHGAPGTTAAEWADHMQPKPPKLWEQHTQQMSDGELFYVISKGVRMTGMPAFGPNHSDEEIWNIVAFVRQLDQRAGKQDKQARHVDSQNQHHGEKTETNL
jgi:mono/diheme cytochrome c family protein